MYLQIFYNSIFSYFVKAARKLDFNERLAVALKVKSDGDAFFRKQSETDRQLYIHVMHAPIDRFGSDKLNEGYYISSL